MSIKQHLLNKELESYKVKLRPIKINKDLLPRLFKKFNDYGMTESSYCCYGEEACCWQEIIEEGVWDLTLDQVERNIKRNIKYIKKYLYNKKKYGERLYIYEDDESCGIFIYCRDLIKTDYHIWFSK